MPTRRDFLVTAGSTGASLSLGLLPPLSGGWRTGQRRNDESLVDQMRRAAKSAPITVKPLRDGVHQIIGLGGNILALEDGDEVTLVDGGMAGTRVASTVASLTKAPISRLINTHWHFDHTDGNAVLGKLGATIIAHSNTRRRLAEPTRVEDFGFTFAALPASGIPRYVFASERKLEVGRTHFTFTPYGPAHTDGDIAVRINDDEILHTGDTWWNGTYPFIDYSTGGSLEGMISATETNLALVSDRTSVIPGHGAVGGRRELRQFHDVLTSARDRVGALKRQGHSLGEIIRKAPNVAYDAAWGTALVDPAFFVRLVYKGIP